MATVYKRKGSKFFELKYRDAAGKWTPVRTRFTTKAEAERLANDLEEKARRQREGLEPMVDKAPAMTFTQAFDWWLEEYGKHLRSQTLISSSPRPGSTCSPRWVREHW